MAWFKCGGGGIPAALKSLMNAVLNKKWGTSGTYPPETWPETVNLMGPLEEKTVSGSVVTFSDGADDVPLKSCVVTIAPTLDGVSSVGVVQAGKNLFDKANPNVVSGYIDTSSFNTGNINAKTVYIPIKGGETYTVSKTAGQRFWIATSEVIPSSGALYTNRKVGNTASSLYVTAGDNDKYLWAWVFMQGTDTGTLEDMLASVQIEVGTTATAYEPYVTPTTHTANLGRTIYGGTVDVVNGTGTDENGNDFTFTAVPVNSLLDDNTLWSDAGDLEVVYRSTGTETIITPTLVTKAITENGTYNAAADNADGYSSVTVNVPTGPSNIETVLGSGVLIEVAGVSGTDVSRTMWTRTAAQDEKVIFHPNTQVKTNTGANDGYFKVLKNGVVVVSTYANTSTTTSFSIPDIDLEAGDVLTISVGFDNYHTSAWFDIWSTITILSSGSAPVLGLGLGNPGPVSEPEEEEPDAAPEEQEEIQEGTPEEVDQNESDE